MAEHMDVVDDHEKRYKNSLTQESGRTNLDPTSQPAKRQRHMAYSQVGGVSPGLIVGVGKAGLIWDHQSVGGLSNQASDQNCRKT